MHTTAYMAYDYAHDKWIVMGLNMVEDALPPSSYIFNRLSNEGSYLFPIMVGAPVKSMNLEDGLYSIIIEDDFEFPEVVTLEQSIENNRKLLSSYK